MEIRDCIADDRLNIYLDGELPPGERSATEAHLAQCLNCRTRLENMRLIGESLRAESLRAVEAADFSEVWDRVRAEAFPRQPAAEPRRAWIEELPAFVRTAFAPFAAAALVLLVVAIYFMTKPLSPPSTPPILEAVADNEADIISLETDSPAVTVLQSQESGATIILISDISTETSEEPAI